MFSSFDKSTDIYIETHIYHKSGIQHLNYSESFLLPLYLYILTHKKTDRIEWEQGSSGLLYYQKNNINNCNNIQILIDVTCSEPKYNLLSPPLLVPPGSISLRLDFEFLSFAFLFQNDF